MPKQGAKRKKTRTHKEETEDDKGIPRSFVIQRKKVKGPIKELLKNTREVLYPYTGMKVAEREKIRMKDYLKACGAYGVTQLFIFTSTEQHNYLKLVKVPAGPTLTFKITSYCLIQDIIDSQIKVRSFPRVQSPPILIMNGFQTEGIPGHYNIVTQAFQSSFAPLNVATQKISQIKRTAYLHYESKTDSILFRQYHIDSTPRNINKNLKRVIKTNKIPDLSKYQDVSDYFLKQAAGVTDSEAEDLPDNMVNFSTKSQISSNQLQHQNALKLQEIGPRMKLKLQKIEEGVMKGNVIYHRFVKKTASEVLEQRTKVQKKIIEKEERRKKMQEILNAKMEERKAKSRFKEKKHEDDEEEEEGEPEEVYDPQMDEENLSDDYDYYVNREEDEDQQEEEEEEQEEEEDHKYE